MVDCASVAVVGVGHTRYGNLPEYDAYDLGVLALKQAVADAGLKFTDLDGLIVNRIPDYQRFCEITDLIPSTSVSRRAKDAFQASASRRSAHSLRRTRQGRAEGERAEAGPD